jgi:hypothetical protein
LGRAKARVRVVDKTVEEAVEEVQREMEKGKEVAKAKEVLWYAQFVGICTKPRWHRELVPFPTTIII